MSISDIFLNLIIGIMNGSILKLPTDISSLPLATIQSNITDHIQVFASAYGFVDHLMPIGLIMKLFGGIIIAEVALHLGWKGLKYIINVFRGSGG
jgi:hypothetical protein